jgi:hypothetical protein
MLIPGNLAESLEHDWLVAEGGSHPASVLESADRFSTAVANWFSIAMALTFPCATAQARRGQLMAQSAAALQAGLPPAAGQALALAVASYMAGQSFGAGVAGFPAAVSAGAALFIHAFVTLDLPQKDRAKEMADGCYAMAVSTIVAFPPPLSPSPIF